MNDSRSEKRREWAAALRQHAGLFAVIASAATLVGFGMALATLNNSDQSGDSQAEQDFAAEYRSASDDITIVTPEDGSVVNPCLRVEGKGSAPRATRLVMAVQMDEDPFRYFEAEVATDDPTDGRWKVDVTLTEEFGKARNQPFTLTPILIEAELAQYLSTTRTTDGDDNTWWVSRAWPPNSVRADSVRVVRDKRTC